VYNQTFYKSPELLYLNLCSAGDQALLLEHGENAWLLSYKHSLVVGNSI
jgi:hypothetical protein